MPGAEEFRILTTCSLGLGFSYQGFQAGLALGPHAIGCDAGSSDFGPFYLGSGKPTKPVSALKRELTTLVTGAQSLGVPFLTGSVGGAGNDAHVDELVGVIDTIARDAGFRLRVASIRAGISRDFIRRKLKDGSLHPLGPVGQLEEEAIDRLAAAVGQMGAEPFATALDQRADVVLAGRATDPSILVAPALRAGCSTGPAWHACKTADKGYLATTRPRDGSPVLARIHDDHFTIEPTREGAACTVETVAGMVLYENHDPFSIVQPGGTIDTSDATYTQIDERRVRVEGSVFRPARQKTVKIEGAELIGHRAVLIAGMRDPRMIARLDDFLDQYRIIIGRVAHSLGVSEEEYDLTFRAYGRDGVLGGYEPMRERPGHEIGLIVDLVARTPQILELLAPRLASTGSRLGLDDGRTGGGNFAFPFSPSVLQAGPVYRWSVWHLAEVSDTEMAEIFPVKIDEVGSLAA